MYIIKNGKIISETGIPCLPRWFCDDLVSFEIDKYGISKVEYFNKKTKGTEKIFVDDMWGGMRFYIDDNGYHSKQNIFHCEMMPYGFVGEWHYEESIFSYEQRVVNNTIYIVLKPIVLKNDNLRFDIEFYDAWCFVPFDHGDVRYTNKVDRNWEKISFGQNILCMKCTDGEESTYIRMTCNNAVKYETRGIGFKKNLLITDEIRHESQIVFTITFDSCVEDADKHAFESIAQFNNIFYDQNKKYEDVIMKSPILESPYASLNNFFALAPLYHESCKIPSVPGGIHAKTEHYWVWGWDGMSSSFAYSYWGDFKYINDMLKMYMNTADKEKGIGHMYARDMSHIFSSTIPAQGFYISLLYQHYINGGDISPYYEFAKKIYQMIEETEVERLGLCKGYSLIPDVKAAIFETGESISAFNNSCCYCAICSMRELSRAKGDTKTYEKASLFAERMKKSFVDVLFDESKGYFSSSADATTLEQRKVYLSPSIKWDNLFCYDLVQKKQKEILKFFEENFVCECGIQFAPVWGQGYDADANQLHCYWPAHSECFARLINFENRKDLIEKFISWISCWTDALMCPEGIDCYDNINEPKQDGWNAVNGTWQAYSMRAWYEAVVHSVVGIDFDQNGMNIYPYNGEEMTLKNFHFYNKSFDIYMRGSGTKIKNVIVNGVSLGSSRNIQIDLFKEINVVEIFRE